MVPTVRQGLPKTNINSKQLYLEHFYIRRKDHFQSELAGIVDNVLDVGDYVYVRLNSGGNSFTSLLLAHSVERTDQYNSTRGHIILRNNLTHAN